MENKTKKNTTKKGTASKKSNAKTTNAKNNTVTSKKVVKSDTKKVEAKKAEVKKVEAKKTEVKKVEAKKVETKKVEPKKIEVKVNEEKKILSSVKDFFKTEIGKLIGIVLIVAAVIALFFAITNIIKNNANNTGKETAEVEIQYDEILISNILKQNNKNYYVFIYDDEDLYNTAYNTYISLYNNKDDALRFYRASLNTAFNKAYFDENSNITSNLDELKFSGSTLVKVSNSKIVASYQGHDEILNHLKSITK